MKSHGFGVLDCDVAKAAYSRNREPFARPGFGLFDAFVSRYTRAEYGRHCDKIHLGGQARHICRRPNGVFGEAPVDAVAAIVLGLAQRHPTRDAVLAAIASIVQPCDSNRIAFSQLLNASTYRGHDPRSLMARNERRDRLHGPITIGRM